MLSELLLPNILHHPVQGGEVVKAGEVEAGEVEEERVSVFLARVVLVE